MTGDATTFMILPTYIASPERGSPVCSVRSISKKRKVACWPGPCGSLGAEADNSLQRSNCTRLWTTNFPVWRDN